MIYKVLDMILELEELQIPVEYRRHFLQKNELYDKIGIKYVLNFEDSTKS